MKTVLSSLFILLAMTLVAQTPAGCEVEPGTLTGGPYLFCVDGSQDIVTDIILTGNSDDSTRWMVTDEALNILSVHSGQSDLDFDQLGAGEKMIWHITYTDGLSGLTIGNTTSDLEGCYMLSNPIAVTSKQSLGGIVSGGIYNVCVDGTADFITDITLNGDSGDGSTWLTTDADSIITGFAEASELFDFDDLSTDTVLVWHLSFTEETTAPVSGQHMNSLVGCYDYSNEVTVIRSSNSNTPAVISGGPFNFCLDGQADYVNSLNIIDGEGDFSRWLVTDSDGMITAVMTNIAALDFDQLDADVYQVYHINYSNTLGGLSPGQMLDNLSGCYALSEPLTVTSSAVEGGTLGGGPYSFCLDGIPDFTGDIELIAASGELSSWLVTDQSQMITAIPQDLGEFDFESLGAGISIIWHIAYVDGLQGLTLGSSVDDMSGCYDLSNPIFVSTADNENVAGTLTGGPYEICIDDESDFITDLSITGNSGAHARWLITDEDLLILQVLTDPSTTDFNQTGMGQELIWHIQFSDGVSGLSAGNHVSDIAGCYALSNSVSLIKGADAGEVSAGPYEVCLGDEPVSINGISVDGAIGASHRWMILDANVDIIAISEDIASYDFNTLPEGSYDIRHLSWVGTIENLAIGNSLGMLEGCYDYSEAIVLYTALNDNMAGTITGGPYEICIDGEPDFILDLTVDGAVGDDERWIITDTDMNIEEVLSDPASTNYDQLMPGSSLIWHISYSDGTSGLSAGANLSDIVGCYALSNSVSIIRVAPAGGTLSGGPYEFCIDGEPDFITDSELIGSAGITLTWVLSSPDGLIAQITSDIASLDLDPLAGTDYQLWALSHGSDIEGLTIGDAMSDLSGCFALSNALDIIRVNEGPACPDGITEAIEAQVSVYPNPAEAYVLVSLGQLDVHNAYLEFIAIDGRVVMTERLSEQNSRHQIDLRGMSAGSYKLRVVTANGIVTKSLQVIR